MQHPTKHPGTNISPVADRTPVRRPANVPARRSNFTPAARAFATPTVRYEVDARYIGPRIETVVKKVMRSEFASLVIVLLVMLAVFSTLFAVALVMGWF